MQIRENCTFMQKTISKNTTARQIRSIEKSVLLMKSLLSCLLYILTYMNNFCLLILVHPSVFFCLPYFSMRIQIESPHAMW